MGTRARPNRSRFVKDEPDDMDVEVDRPRGPGGRFLSREQRQTPDLPAPAGTARKTTRKSSQAAATATRRSPSGGDMEPQPRKKTARSNSSNGAARATTTKRASSQGGTTGRRRNSQEPEQEDERKRTLYGTNADTAQRRYARERVPLELYGEIPRSSSVMPTALPVYGKNIPNTPYAQELLRRGAAGAAFKKRHALENARNAQALAENTWEGFDPEDGYYKGGRQPKPRSLLEPIEPVDIEDLRAALVAVGASGATVDDITDFLQTINDAKMTSVQLMSFLNLPTTNAFLRHAIPSDVRAVRPLRRGEPLTKLLNFVVSRNGKHRHPTLPLAAVVAAGSNLPRMTDELHRYLANDGTFLEPPTDAERQRALNDATQFFARPAAINPATMSYIADYAQNVCGSKLTPEQQQKYYDVYRALGAFNGKEQTAILRTLGLAGVLPGVPSTRGFRYAGGAVAPVTVGPALPVNSLIGHLMEPEPQSNAAEYRAERAEWVNIYDNGDGTRRKVAKPRNNKLGLALTTLFFSNCGIIDRVASIVMRQLHAKDEAWRRANADFLQDLGIYTHPAGQTAAAVPATGHRGGRAVSQLPVMAQPSAVTGRAGQKSAKGTAGTTRRPRGRAASRQQEIDA